MVFISHGYVTEMNLIFFVFSHLLDLVICPSSCCSVHIKADEKISLTANRYGGLQNMEVRGMMMLRISDPALTGITLSTDNNNARGFQVQV